MNSELRDLVDDAWVTVLGVDRTLLDAGGVHVVAGELGLNDAMSFMLGKTCIVLVREDEIGRTQQRLSGVDAVSAFTDTALRQLLGDGARIDGPSIHMYADEENFTGLPDPSASRVEGHSTDLVDFLRSNDRADWAESGFPEHPEIDGTAARFWLLHEEGRVVAAGNMTEWRGLPSDVGVLTSASNRGRGLARRLVGAMVEAALPEVRFVRYRALESNAPSIAVAQRLGFEQYGANFRGRRCVG